jgi:diguanylate cyclase (GGDEF)-like protein/PAS domain S-box-containing protein
MKGTALSGRGAGKPIGRYFTRSWQAWWWLGLGLVATGLHLVEPTSLMGQLSYLAVAVSASAVAWIGAGRAVADRTVGRLIALGVTLSAAGDLVFQALEWLTDSPPDVSVADVPWLCSYLALSAALLRMLRLTRHRHGAFRDVLVDVAVISVLVLLVEWELSVGALVTDSSQPVLSRVVWALYPAFDAVLIALVLRVVATRHHLRGMSVVFAAGAMCWLLADFAYLVIASADVVSTWLDTGWLLGAMLLAASTWQRPDAAPEARETRMGLGSIALAMLPLLVPGVIELLAWLRGNDANPIALLGAIILLVVLAFLRGARLLASEARARELLRSQERYSSAVAANSSDAVLVLDADGVIRNDAPQFAALLGSPEAPTRGAQVLDFATPVDLVESDAAFARALLSPGHVFEAEFEVADRDGRPMWLGTRLVNLLEDPDVAGVVVNIHDATHRKLAEQELVHQAFHDSLTGLPNRALFGDRVGQALERDRRTPLHAAVLYLDLDGFKGVNDSFGHEAGDRLLCEVAHRLLSAVRAGDTVTRLGGDEFAILLEQSNRPIAEAQEVSRRILQSLLMPVEIESQLVTISASVGIALADSDSTAASLMRDADIAMYRAKAVGKGQSVVYEPSMRTAAVERLRIENDLVHALERDQLRLAYQPVVLMETGEILGFEALLRWHHPELGVLPPDKFIPVAEESGLIAPIGQWVLGEACRQAAQWRRDLPASGNLSMAVNVSGRQVASDTLVQHVATALADSGLAPSSLVLEMTETVLIQDPETAAARLQELRRLGVRLAVDDFGTGYSSLSYLRQFSVDILKVDRSFVATITDAVAIPPIVRGLLDLGRTLGLEIIAEGVEYDVQREVLLAQGCDLAQGFLFARPLSPSDARTLLTGTLRSAAAVPTG